PFAALVPPHAAKPPESRERHPLSPFAAAGFGGASNAWAVDASRSAAGAPLLATDPHLWLSAPGVWHLARMTSPGFDVIGATLPGVPAVVIGRNRDFGWGLTTAMVDDQDLYIERLNPDDPNEYLAPEGWTPFQTRAERIAVAGRPAETITLRWSRHGPIIEPGGDLDFSAVTPPGHVVALAWTALTAEDRSIEAVLGLMRARTIEQGAAALRRHLAPAQNVIMADADGVGMVTAGAIPLRREDSRSRGRTPSVGWLVENDWIGFMDPDETPRAIRPESGAVANANNRTTSAPFPRHVSFEWEAPYRIRRIETRLNDRPFHTRDSFMEMQNDPVSDMARGVLPLIAREMWWGDRRSDAESDGPQAQRREAALALLADWNGAMTQHDPEPLIFSAWMRHLTRRLAEDELGPLFPLIAGQRPLFVERVFRDIDGAGRWCNVVKTDQTETCADMARWALDDALDELTRTYGDGPAGWRWGQAHRAIHAHTPLGLIAPLRPFVNIEHESGGGDFAIMAAGTPGRGPRPDLNVMTAGFRAVYDFADLDRSMFVIATGQSGHPLSRHYDDLNALWRRGDYIPMSLNPEDARAGARGITRLTPAG
ncbi:MAG: penicillin acylase family protein, partial [Rubrimonas sp.]